MGRQKGEDEYGSLPRYLRFSRHSPSPCECALLSQSLRWGSGCRQVLSSKAAQERPRVRSRFVICLYLSFLPVPSFLCALLILLRPLDAPLSRLLAYFLFFDAYVSFSSRHGIVASAASFFLSPDPSVLQHDGLGSLRCLSSSPSLVFAAPPCLSLIQRPQGV